MSQCQRYPKAAHRVANEETARALWYQFYRPPQLPAPTREICKTGIEISKVRRQCKNQMAGHPTVSEGTVTWQ